MGSSHKLHSRDSHHLCILDSPAMPPKFDDFLRRQTAPGEQPLRQLPGHRLPEQLAALLAVDCGGNDGRVRSGDNAQPPQALQGLQMRAQLIYQALEEA